MTRSFRIYAIVLAAVLMAVASSCSKFTYGGTDRDEASVYAAVAMESKEQCHILMSRLVNSCHYMWDMDDMPRKVRFGEYFAIAYRASDLYEITSLQEFSADPSVSMQDIYAVLPSDAEDYGKFALFNPYSSFVSGADGILEVDFKRVSVADTSMILFFAPESLTQTITFRLKVRTGAGVEVEGLRAAVSGVPSKVRLMSGLVRNDTENTTRRQCVPMTEIGGVYEGTVSMLGLFPPVSESHTSGPGIFQVEVNASVEDGGRLYDRVFYAGINLKDVIERAALMEEAEDRSGYRIRVRQAVIEVPVVLELQADRVVSGEGEGLVQWFENDADIEVEI